MNNNPTIIAITVISITALIIIAYFFWKRFASKNNASTNHPTMPEVTRPGIRKVPLHMLEKPKPRLGPTVVPAITVTMHETDISRSVTVPSLDFAFLDEYASAAGDSEEGMGIGAKKREDGLGGWRRQGGALLLLL